MRTSLIITTYNWPEALSLLLRSVIAQSVKPDEVVIADDGSGEETARAVKKVLGTASFKWKHVRHADESIRQSRIKNLAVKHSCGNYLIFVDHDIILHPGFVEDHVAMARKGVFLLGKRVLLSRLFTEEVVGAGLFRKPRAWKTEIENRKNAIRWPLLGKLVSRKKSFEQSLRGCNLSMSRDDFMKVDGYDEIFDGIWGREDSDICFRLFHSGLKARNLWFQALQYHLHHNLIVNRQRDRLDEELELNLREKRARAVKGFSALSSEGGLIAQS